MQETQKTWVRFLGGGNGNPIQYSCLENPMDRGDWQAIVHENAESDTTEGTQHACTYPCYRVTDSIPECFAISQLSQNTNEHF